MALPSLDEAQTLLEQYVSDPYQRFHARMVAICMRGYASLYNGDEDLWYITGLLHDIDYEQHPDVHPKESLSWFSEWGYPDELIHAVEAHAYGYNGYTTLPETPLASALMACDELCGIFYAYRQMNPIPYGQMKAKSIKKKFKDKSFAAKINRDDITRGIEALGVDLDTHVHTLI